MARRIPKPDHRPSWRNPSLPCIRDYRFSNGERRTEVEPSYEQRYREMLVQTSTALDWRSDPTYALRRRKR